MSEEFSTMPNMDMLLAQRIADKTGAQTKSEGGFDPYKSLLKKKTEEMTPIDPETIQKWPEEQTKELETYCQKVGIVGFNSGKMPPIVALAMLKRQFGDYTGVPLEERLPPGYEKVGTKSNYGPNYPYSKAMQNKQILHG
jgi:hypothetical protein